MTIEIPKKEYTIKLPKIENRIKEIALSFRYLASDSPNVHTYTVYDNFTVSLGAVNIICGASGCGKTSLLSYFEKKINNTIRLEEIFSNELIINLVGDTTTEAIQILNYVGLGEGNLFLRKFQELSDGQKFRFKIAYQIYKTKQLDRPVYLLIDEFGGTIDVQTAKGIAITMSKIHKIYKNIKFILCCNNREIAESFDYDALIIMNYDNSVDVQYAKSELSYLDMQKYIVKKATGEDYKQFKKYHYLDLPRGDYDIYVMEDVEKHKYISCFVLSHVIPQECINLHKDFKSIYDSIINIKRQVVLPEYRAQGIAKKFLQELCKIRNEKIIEVSSALFHYAPIPLKCGFESADEFFDGYYNSHRDANEKIRSLMIEQGYQPYELMDDEIYNKFIHNSDLEALRALAYEDGKERMNSIIYYYYMLMKKYELEIDAEYEELRDLFQQVTIPNISDEDFKYLIQNNEQPSYAAFSCKNIYTC